MNSATRECIVLCVFMVCATFLLGQCTKCDGTLPYRECVKYHPPKECR